jgi:hypothetical protein
LLVATIAGLRVELIGAHLRSKLNSTRTGIWEDEARTTFTEPYLKEVMNDRIKLATEAESNGKHPARLQAITRKYHEVPGGAGKQS